ncbi:DUF4354 family protein [Robbsia sp. KACC 23696]|uniref:DUF4354 family protein n=1 Tax=Robbsia sp. KACC 23696 TaxID=3149231 RepID=UPI00325C25A4
MKPRAAITSCLLVMTPLSAWANEPDLDLVVVYSQPDAQSAKMTGTTARYTKQFRIGLAYLSEEKLDLSKLCLSAYSPDGKRFPLAAIDAKLTEGHLRTPDVVKGRASFDADDPSVYSAVIVKAAKCGAVAENHSDSVTPKHE